MHSLIMVAALLLSTSAQQDFWTKRGGDFVLDKETPITTILDHAADHHDRTLRTRGIVAAVSSGEGWFMEIVAEDDPHRAIMVKCPGHGETFPLDCVGKTAIVEGLFYQKIYPASRVQHWQAHGFRPNAEVPPYSLVLRMSANAARIGGPSKRVPPPTTTIKAGAIEKIDLRAMEFEDDGFGVGRKELKPGGQTPEHTTGSVREMILCLAGTLTVEKEGYAPVTITEGDMAFIPPKTKHAIRNNSKASATYVFVNARVIPTESAGEHHGHSHDHGHTH